MSTLFCLVAVSLALSTEGLRAMTGIRTNGIVRTSHSSYELGASTTTGSPVLDEVTHRRELLINVPGSFRPSIVDKARTITHVCTSGTLCTMSVTEGAEGVPFGSYVDYVLDDKGWPVLLLSAQSIHTINVKSSSLVSLFAQLPRAQSKQAAAALSRVTVMGDVVDVDPEELSALQLAFTLAHPYAEQIVGAYLGICHTPYSLFFIPISIPIPIPLVPLLTPQPFLENK